ncbi:MAG: YraN family protein [Candidatus Uhrbacteria bacterium]
MDPRRLFGNKCEVMAAQFLEGKGYKILAHQFKTRAGEIDLVAEKDKEIIFVEVKARKNINFGYPEIAVNRNKLCKMVMVGQDYLEKNNLNDRSFRLDVIAIVWPAQGEVAIEHLEGVDTGSLE